MKNGKGAIVVHTDVTKAVSARQEERALAEVAKSSGRLQAESEYLREEIQSRHNFENIIDNSECIWKTLHRLAPRIRLCGKNLAILDCRAPRSQQSNTYRRPPPVTRLFTQR